MKLQVIFFVCLVAAALAFECKKDVKYERNGCNTCHCLNGELTCTLKACTEEIHEKLKNCEVGKEWKHKCNDCHCLKDIGTICTDNPC